LVRDLIDADLNAKFRERAHDFGIEVRDRPRREADPFLRAIVAAHPEHMIDEIELELKVPHPIGNWRGAQAPDRDIERDMPGMIEPRSLGHADLADDLAPKVQGRIAVLPCLVRKLWPVGR